MSILILSIVYFFVGYMVSAGLVAHNSCSDWSKLKTFTIFALLGPGAWIIFILASIVRVVEISNEYRKQNSKLR